MSQLTKEIFIDEVRKLVLGYMESKFGTRIIMGDSYALYDAEKFELLESPTYYHLLAMAAADIVVSKQYTNIPSNTVQVYKDLENTLGEGWRATPLINVYEKDQFDWSHVNTVLVSESQTFFQVVPFAIAFGQLYLSNGLLPEEGQPSIDYSEYRTALDEDLKNEIAGIFAEEYQAKFEAQKGELAKFSDSIPGEAL
ncbi:hypothetical protein TOTORO_02450 [Serratia phage vB_SmaS-Totoro]|nr:hypothetical protein TOTORO_02450 [Serratia phage vB_SmaS-Totoro]